MSGWSEHPDGREMRRGSEPTEEAGPGPGRDIPRREALKRMGVGALGLGAGYGLPAPVLESFLRTVREGTYVWAFFRPAELETMNMLADMIIPADERSGSATDAGTVEYVDFVLSISDEATQETWRDGLAWLDEASATTHRELAGDPDGAPSRFVDATPGVRARVLDSVAWPDGVAPELEDRARWFSRVRDLVGSGFFSSRVGVDDIGYIGAYMNPVWNGAPPEALRELGLSYEKWDARYGEGS